MNRSSLFVLSLILFSLFFFMVKSEKSSGPGILQQGDSFIEGLRIVHKMSGNRDWVLTAKRADMTENGEKAFLTDIEMKMEKKGMVIHAGKGLYNMTDKSLIVDGRIAATGDDYTIETENVNYDSKAGSLKTDGNIKMDGKKFSLQGKGMDMNNIEQKVRILSNVKATFYH